MTFLENSLNISENVMVLLWYGDYNGKYKRSAKSDKKVGG